MREHAHAKVTDLINQLGPHLFYVIGVLEILRLAFLKVVKSEEKKGEHPKMTIK